MADLSVKKYNVYKNGGLIPMIDIFNSGDVTHIINKVTINGKDWKIAHPNNYVAKTFGLGAGEEVPDFLRPDFLFTANNGKFITLYVMPVSVKPGEKLTLIYADSTLHQVEVESDKQKKKFNFN